MKSSESGRRFSQLNVDADRDYHASEQELDITDLVRRGALPRPTPAVAHTKPSAPATAKEEAILSVLPESLPAQPTTATPLATAHQSASPPAAAPNPVPDRVVCLCMNIYASAIERAIRKLNLTSVDDVRQTTAAGITCGCCHADIQAMVDRHLSRTRK